ncbi:PAS domain S-box protein [Raineya orbicola]|jgi:PAS domain S-box-containing protein|uniref:histidine kinase n=1 Tax=Raineya orbicola TaxID=2016530 RepID=A0A2N3I8B6_9BACT|nr:PAS domain S-box protein [Raineya orbicola]PKQ66582.1 PAS domain S-box protein [Raineya orbicola]
MNENLLWSATQYSRLINQVLDNLQDAFCVISQEGNILKYNQTFKNFFAKETNLTNIHSISQFLSDNLYEAFKLCLESSQTQNGEYFCTKSQKWLEYTLYPFELGIVILMKDITERKLQSDKIKQSEFFLKAILDSTSDSNFLLDRQGNILCFNKAAAENIARHYGKEIKVGQNMLAEYSLPNTSEALKQNFISALQGQMAETERLLSFPNGEQVWVHLRVFPVFNENNEVWAIALNYTNIHEIKIQYEKLAEIARLQSHYIRRPLSSILGLINILNTDGISTDNQEIIERLKESAEELDKIIHEIVYKTY